MNETCNRIVVRKIAMNLVKKLNLPPNAAIRNLVHLDIQNLTTFTLPVIRCYSNQNGGLPRTYKSIADMPGPKPCLPFFGTSWIYGPFGHYTKDQMLTTAKEELLEKYGPLYKEQMGGVSIVNLHDPKHIEAVMRHQGKIPMRVVNEAMVYWRRKHPDLYRTVGLVDSIGGEWHELRQKVAPSVLKPFSVSVFVERLSKLADAFVSAIRLGRERDTHEIQDIRHYLYSYSLEAIWRCTIGSELGALKSMQSEEAKALIDLSMNLFHSLAALSLSRPWWKLLPTSDFKTFCRSEDAIFRIVNRFTLDSGKAENHTDADGVIHHDSSTPQVSLLNRFLTTKDLDRRDINTVIMDFISAGIPTTSYFLSLLLHKLGQEKNLQRRIQEEIREVIPDKNMPLTDSVFKSLPLLTATIQEGFRLTTIIPAIMRLLPTEIICDSYRIPAYTPVLCQTRAAALSDKYFTSAEKFIPERWIRPKAGDSDSPYGDLQRQARSHHFLVLPFGFGPRMCVGKRLAEKEILTLLTKIFLNFTIVSEGDLELGNYFIIGPKGPVSLKFVDIHC